ncbi:AMP-binding protein [Actinocorallia sp. API 0066]|uniref:AMP-binding protein n=1 Tax=Actinocorallia sp. API 0066 TaxID=2896846 RepID=UPI001E653468|nr:AMP-binding protein [Actinocorallia sp. API 0066]MCD0448228.1 AMP-binding protein [Actinocorallia sp. API 0066]
MDSLWEPILAARRSRVNVWTGDRFSGATWGDVVADARRMSGGLRKLGVGPGVRVATILTNTPLAVRGVLAVWLAGGAVASLPVPARGMSMDEYLRQIVALCERIGSPVLLSDAALAGTLPEWAAAATSATPWEAVSLDAAPREHLPGPDDVAFLQFSSGSTSLPKGCVLTPRAIAEQITMIRAMTEAEPDRESVVSWLPLSHDMGMFGCLVFPWYHDMPLALSSPERFAFGARTWFDDLAAFGATMTAGTNTALHLAVRAQRGRPLRAPLDLRVAIVAAERVERDTLLAAVEEFGDAGLTLEAFMPAYGMAEATLAVTATPPRQAPAFLSVDNIELAEGRITPVDPTEPTATWLTGCGRAVPGVEVAETRPGSVSELLVRSPSLARGYHGDPERTAARFTPDGLRTGDLGFLRDGELYFAGRLDDVISVGGRNVNTLGIEAAIDALAPIRRGCSAIIDVDDGRRGRLVLVTELQDHRVDPEVVAGLAADVAMSKAGIALAECVFLRRGSLPKTPSGKVQRYRCRQLLRSGALPRFASVGLGA